jgi:hypothetical protein
MTAWFASAIAAVLALAALTDGAAAQSRDTATASISSNASANRAAAPAATRPLTCADKYHARLQAIADNEYRNLEAALATITSANAIVPEAWRFWLPVRPRGFSKRRRKDGTIRPIVYRGRVCADERTMRNGRPRCFKWDPATKERIAALTRYAPPLDPAADRRERRDLRFLNDTIVSKGALSAFGEDGRFYWLVRRANEELGFYVRQDLKPGICRGVPVMMSFYAQQMKPLDDRIAYVETLAKRADARLAAQIKRLDQMEAGRRERDARIRREAIAAREKAEADARKARQEAAARASKADADGTVQPAALVAPTVELPPVPPPEREPRPLPDGRIGQVARLLAFLTPRNPDDEPVLNTAIALPDALDRARAYIDQRREEPFSRQRRTRILRALRAIETRMIAETTLAIYTTYRGAVRDTLTAISQAHRETCDCAR